MYEQFNQVLSQLNDIWRNRWHAVAAAWIIALGGWYGVHRLPDRYEASARVYVDTQTVLRPLLSGIAVQPNLDQMVQMMSRTLISRPNLDKVIEMNHLDAGLKTDAERAELVSHLVADIIVASGGKENLYSISFFDKDPKVAAQVVQSLLTMFVTSSVEDKRRDSQSAQQFIDDQLDEYRKSLDESETAVSEFKRRHVGLMPVEAGAYVARLADTRAVLNQSELELKESEDARDSIKKQLARTSEILLRPENENTVEDEINPEIDARLRTLEQKLDGLRLIYTEQHPDIVAILPIIAQLKEQKKAAAKLRGPIQSAPQVKDPVYQQLTVTLSATEAKIAGLKARVAEYSKRYTELQAAAYAVPQIEANYLQLTRDYAVNKARYDELLKRREQAKISADLEESGAGLAFQVIEPAKIPTAPVKPNRPILMTLVLIVAIGGGAGFGWLSGQIKPTFNDERGLKRVGQVPVLGTVAMDWTDKQKVRRVGGRIAFLFSLAGLLSAYAAIMAALALTASRV